jgi:hypothetical protein
LNKFTDAKLRNLASQEVAYIRLVNLESLFQIRLTDAFPFDVKQEISPKIGFDLRFERLRPLSGGNGLSDIEVRRFKGSTGLPMGYRR